jgi:hypothetical protein
VGKEAALDLLFAEQHPALFSFCVLALVLAIENQPPDERGPARGDEWLYGRQLGDRVCTELGISRKRFEELEKSP